MLALLINEAAHRGVPSCVLTFEPHPRDYFAKVHRKPELAPGARRHPARQAHRAAEMRRRPVRDPEVRRPPVQAWRPEAFIADVLVKGLGASTCWWATTSALAPSARATTRCSDSAGSRLGFDVARMNSYEVHGLRVSSSAVREALARGDMAGNRCPAGAVPTASAATWCMAANWAATSASRRSTCAFSHWKPAASGIFAVRVHGLDGGPLEGVANLGSVPRWTPTTSTAGGCCWRTHCLQWPASLGEEGGYGKIIRVELLHKLHDELRYDGLEALKAGIARDCDAARGVLRFHARRNPAADHARPNLTTSSPRPASRIHPTLQARGSRARPGKTSS
jgi:riboflavin kinase/FMN adenylyltransferase